ncbi:hypothetical protein OAW23_05730 [Flavobacteriales bacterium]|nr:hypothetical protein [Flavobacteriales bacterium]
MKSTAEKNLQEISLSEVKEKLKELNPSEFDKMIIDSNCTVERCNYHYVNYAARSAEKQSMFIRFPMYPQIANNFAEYEGGDAKHGELAYFPSNKILDNLSLNHQIEPESDPIGSAANFSFPLDTDGDSISLDQKYYFISDRTYKETCDECTGKKLVSCDDFDCDGRHIWTCEDCAGKGQNTCDTCAGSKKVVCGTCDGRDTVRCSKCGGDGKVNDGLVAKAANSKYAQEKRCGKCQGRGHVPCNNCTRGRVVCSPCTGQGKVTCSTCSGKKKITCSNCYGDKERFGMIDCPTCKAQGEMAQIAFVKTSINKHQVEKLFDQGNGLQEITESEVLSYANNGGSKQRMITNINEQVVIERDEIVEQYATTIQNELGLSLDDFNKLLEEDLYYQVIPCVQIKYTHMLTNTSHEVSILNFFESPSLKFHQEVEEVKSDIKDKGKKVGRFFGKLLKTKSFKSKDDKKKEIKLLIYLAKADGIIEDEEKSFLAENINSIDEFTSNEKQEFFDLMNTASLPQLTAEDVKFSSDDRFNEMISKLESLAASDGEMEQAESDLISSVKSLKS